MFHTLGAGVSLVAQQVTRVTTGLHGWRVVVLGPRQQQWPPAAALLWQASRCLPLRRLQLAQVSRSRLLHRSRLLLRVVVMTWIGRRVPVVVASSSPMVEMTGIRELVVVQVVLVTRVMVGYLVMPVTGRHLVTAVTLVVTAAAQALGQAARTLPQSMSG